MTCGVKNDSEMFDKVPRNFLKSKIYFFLFRIFILSLVSSCSEAEHSCDSFSKGFNVLTQERKKEGKKERKKEKRKKERKKESRF